MKAIVCEAFGGPEVLALREVPDPPPPGPGEVQVRIGARGVQYVDVLMLAGKYQFRPEPPFVPGNEGAGEVVAVGDGVTRFKLGDKIMSRHRLGAFAELGNARAEDCNPVPTGHEPRTGGGVPRRLPHRLSRAVAARPAAAGRVGADQRRRRRHRHRRDPGRQTVRRHRHRHRQHRRKTRRLPGGGRRLRDRLPRRVARQGQGTDRQARRRRHRLRPDRRQRVRRVAALPGAGAGASWCSAFSAAGRRRRAPTTC